MTYNNYSKSDYSKMELSELELLSINNQFDHVRKSVLNYTKFNILFHFLL
jgi:hypothetical protein